MDEYIKLALYALNLRGQYCKTKANTEIENEIRALIGLLRKYSLRMMQLNVHFLYELDLNSLREAKSNFFGYQDIQRRHPEIVTKEVEIMMNNLARRVSYWEGQLLYENTRTIIDYENFREYLQNPIQANRIAKDFLYEIAESYLCDSALQEGGSKSNQRVESVTIFIDETNKKHPLHPKGGLVSNYSFIIAKGKIKKESELNYANIVCEKVGQVRSTNHVEDITLEAIGNALFTLLYDYNYTQDVHIWIDNLTAKHHWNKKKKELALYKCFNSVNVSHVSRGYNTKADALSRQNVVVTFSKAEFDKLEQFDLANQLKNYFKNEAV
ncbi:hypothetical protein [Pseudobutyrivibrio xylanivorans]|uniref:hypothetical protein n=1 Tax=Pseudobutyrivibrio xylanivorans TaxID=185007 RepID=UPI00124D30A1|nr:hypothetical protein [Pseudobutyrivibrio xylanivorans]